MLSFSPPTFPLPPASPFNPLISALLGTTELKGLWKPCLPCYALCWGITEPQDQGPAQISGTEAWKQFWLPTSMEHVAGARLSFTATQLISPQALQGRSAYHHCFTCKELWLIQLQSLSQSEWFQSQSLSCNILKQMRGCCQVAIISAGVMASRGLIYTLLVSKCKDPCLNSLQSPVYFIYEGS